MMHFSPCCPAKALASLLTLLFTFAGGGVSKADDWPGWLGPRRDGIWREKGILTQFPSSGPRIVWRKPLGGGYAGPAVAGGRVYVTDRQLDVGARNPDNPFLKDAVRGKERVLCLEEATGNLLWKYEYPSTYTISYACGPRTTPVVHDGKVYTLGAMGLLLCLDAEKGTLLWSRDFPRDYSAPAPLWGWAAHPLLDGDQLICLVGGSDSICVAFNASTGKEIWRSGSFSRPGTEIGYCPPMIYQVGSRRQLIIWHPEAAQGLEPETGKLIWSVPWSIKANLTISTPRLEGSHLLFTSFYNGAMMLDVSGDPATPQVVWRSKVASENPERTDTLNCIISTPFMEGGYIYGVCSYGDLRCLKASNARRLWTTLKATCSSDERERWANAFLIRHEDHFFLPNEKGDLIIARLKPEGYHELDRAHILAPTGRAMGRRVVWSHPAFANKHMFARNDKEIVCVDLSQSK